MINYYFFQLIKKNRTRPCPSRRVRPPGANGEWVRFFLIWTAYNRPVWTVRDREPYTRDHEPSGFGPDRTVFKSLDRLNSCQV
jgi:hypothetical protein